MKKKDTNLSRELRNIRNVVKPSSYRYNENVLPQKTVVNKPVQNKRINFFEHKETREVYGDEGLTLFDSQKKRSNGSTANLFGVYD